MASKRKLRQLTAENLQRLRDGKPMKQIRGRLGWHIPGVTDQPALQDIHPASYRSEEVEGTCLMTNALYLGASVRASLFHIPNGGGRSAAEAGKLKAQGVKPGVSDYFLAFPTSGFHGLWIELKACDGRPDGNQIDWLASRIAVGYAGCVAYGSDAAIDAIKSYLNGQWPALRAL